MHQVGAAGLDREFAARAHRPSLETGEHPLLERGQVGEGIRANDPVADVLGRNDVRGQASRGNDAVDTIGVAGLLAQQADRHLRDGHRVGGVDTQLGVRAGVCGAAPVGDVENRDGRSAQRRGFVGSGVHHHGGVGPVESAAVEHQNFPAAALLSRCAQHRDGQAKLVGHGSEAEARPDGRRRDDVVPAGVPHLRERVVLSAHHDVARPGSCRRADRGGQVVTAVFDLEASGGQCLRDPSTGQRLLEREFWMGVDAVGEREEVRLRRPDPRRHVLLDRTGSGQALPGHGAATCTVAGRVAAS